MGVKGLQTFMERCCPDACVIVNLREVANKYVSKNQDCPSSSHDTNPTLVVDGMACLRHWYTSKDWLCGGQWREYMEVLKSWVETFTAAGIRLVFFFDGVVKEQKRPEWVKRRRRVNGEVSKIFHHIKTHMEHPGRQLFCLPSGLATFTCFALRSLSQEVFCTVQEADYEIASYACQHSSMGILGQDSDFLIYDSAPYFSVERLRIESLTTVLYDRHRLCQSLGLVVTQLPLLASLLGNDVVSEKEMHHIRNDAMATYRKYSPSAQTVAPRDQVVLAVSHLVSSVWGRERDESGLIPEGLNLSGSQREILQRGTGAYLLPGQWGHIAAPFSAPAFEKHVSPEILKACREKHMAAEGFMVYGVVWEGVIECSNTLEDEHDPELLPQALVYKPCRQLIYGLLLLDGKDDICSDLPAVREWFVYPANSLREPDMVHPVPLTLPCAKPRLDLLWFGTGPEVAALRLTTFLSIFDCFDYFELYGKVEDSLMVALCLLTYIVLQIKSLSQEDLDAYLSQAVCLRLKSVQELQQIKLPFLCSRAVQLGSLYVRGLSHLLGANCASGGPLPKAALMPWHSFDGRLFHLKYLLAHSGVEKAVLLESDPSLSLFLCLREKLIETCRKRGRILESRPNKPEQGHKPTPGTSFRGRSTGGPPGSGDSWRNRGGGGWREKEKTRQDRRDHERRPWERGGHTGGHYFDPLPCFDQNLHDGGPLNTSHHPNAPGVRSHHTRGRYRPAPRWSQPPAPGT